MRTGTIQKTASSPHVSGWHSYWRVAQSMLTAEINRDGRSTHVKRRSQCGMAVGMEI